MKRLLLLLLAGFSINASQGAESLVFQRDSNGYQGAMDGLLSGNPEESATRNLWGEKELHIAGTPTGGKKRVVLMRFDDIFGNAQNQIPPGSTIVKAQLGLYKIDEEADTGQYSTAKPAHRVITLHRMLTAFQPGHPDGESEAFSCNSYKSYGVGDDSYWGRENSIEAGPVESVDYEKKHLARIPLEVGVMGEWYWFDVTQEVQAWANGMPNNGFLLRAHGWWIGATFASGQYEDPTLRPQLVVEWKSQTE